MNETKPLLDIYIGYDPKEAVAFHVLQHSIMERTSIPVRIIPLVQRTLRDTGAYTRERGPTESTEFSMTRFLCPYMSGYKGISVFMDCDMLCLTDMADVLIETYRSPVDWAVRVCKHDYAPKPGVKFLGNVQTVYPRKNWSSFMVFNNSACRDLTPEYISTASGLDLHRFNWTTDDKIGDLPLEWNWLVGEYAQNDLARIFHYTLGGPYFDEYRDCDHADLWFREFRGMTGGVPCLSKTS